MSDSQDVVLYSVEDGVALLTLNRPDRMNAWTGEMQVRYFDLLDRAAAEPDVRVAVVTGAGKGFCPGADMNLLQGMGGGTESPALGGPVQGRLTIHPTSFPKPLVMAINGACAGVGLVQALMGDVRFAAEGVKFTTAFARRGLIAEYGSSWLLPRLVGASNAADLLLSARVVLADEALAMGLVNRVVPKESLLEETMAYARDIAQSCSPASLAAIKGQLFTHSQLDLATANERTEDLMRQSLQGPDFKEGVSSYVEKRPPAFAPLGQGTSFV